jgi:4-amino-4-deoxy-L-arabinose transferase-like glycosyltransferase
VEVSSWAGRHAAPFWEYWNFPVFAGIWAPVALVALAVPFARARAGRYVPYAAGLGWLLATLLLLSIIPEKKERYMLPLMPPLALLMAGLLRHFETALSQPNRPGLETRLLRWWAGLLGLAFALVPVALELAWVPRFLPAGQFGVAAVAFGLLAGAAWWGGFRRRQPGALIASSLTGMSLLLALLLPAHAAWVRRRADPGLRHAADLRHNPELAHRPWYTLEELNMKQLWEAGRAAPAWPRTPDSALVRPTRVVAVLSGADVASQLPRSWRQQVRLRVVDSFYLGQERKDGYWRVTLVEPIGPAAAAN